MGRTPPEVRLMDLPLWDNIPKSVGVVPAASVTAEIMADRLSFLVWMCSSLSAVALIPSRMARSYGNG